MQRQVSRAVTVGERVLSRGMAGPMEQSWATGKAVATRGAAMGAAHHSSRQIRHRQRPDACDISLSPSSSHCWQPNLGAAAHMSSSRGAPRGRVGWGLLAYQISTMMHTGVFMVPSFSSADLPARAKQSPSSLALYASLYSPLGPYQRPAEPPEANNAVLFCF